jgi:hypothetical protein
MSSLKSVFTFGGSKDATQVFPARFESDVELVGGPVKDSLTGFLVLEDFQSRKTKAIL